MATLATPLSSQALVALTYLKVGYRKGKDPYRRQVHQEEGKSFPGMGWLRCAGRSDVASGIAGVPRGNDLPLQGTRMQSEGSTLQAVSRSREGLQVYGWRLCVGRGQARCEREPYRSILRLAFPLVVR